MCRAKSNAAAVSKHDWAAKVQGGSNGMRSAKYTQMQADVTREGCGCLEIGLVRDGGWGFESRGVCAVTPPRARPLH